MNGTGKILIILVMKWHGKRKMPVSCDIWNFPLQTRLSLNVDKVIPSPSEMSLMFALKTGQR